MTKIKSALEIAMEKVNETNKLTKEEKDKIKDVEKIKSSLAKYYKSRLTSEGLYSKLKGVNPSSLKEAQLILINSISLKLLEDEFELRKKGILAIESLKAEKYISILESNLNEISLLQKKYHKIKDTIANKLKSEIEKNPKSRVKTVKQGDNIMVIQLSVEEALNENAQWKNFIIHHDEEFGQKFTNIINRLKRDIH